MGVKRGVRSAAAFLLLAASTQAQQFTKEDSGWVPLFNGKDYSGMYSRMYNGPVTNYPNINPIFTVRYGGTDTAEMYVKQGGATLGTIRTDYSHFRVRVQYRFDDIGGHNAGLLYGIDETYPRMGGDGTAAKGNWPRSIECQMLQGDAGDAFSIQQVTFDTRVTNGKWDPDGKAIKVCEHGCDGRNFGANPELDRSTTHWTDEEAIVRGADSAIHLVAHTPVFKLWNIRITDNNGKDMVPPQPWGKGSLGLEAENAVVHYRRFEVMELPPTGPNYLNRLFLDAPAQGESLAAKSTYTLKWRKIGDFKKVHLEYDAGSGFKTLADSVDNTGSFAWTVPGPGTQSLRIRISGPAYVRADTSGVNGIVTGTAVLPATAGPRFTFGASAFSLADIAPGSSLRIEDAAGRLVRELRVGGETGGLTWDGRDQAGRLAPPGPYFARVPGHAGPRLHLTVP
jgi:hypothetical protein